MTDRIDAVETRSDFIAFMSEIEADLTGNRHMWQNDGSLVLYLQALTSWAESWDERQKAGELHPELSGLRPIRLSENPGWQALARMLDSASVYE